MSEGQDDGEVIANLASDVLDDGTAANSFVARAICDGRLSGIALVNHAAPEMIAPFAALLASGASADDLAAVTGVHPSFGEETVGP